MINLFSQILNMSLTASVIILCVLAARLVLKKAPKVYSYALWAVVLFRLLCPVSLTASVSVLEVTKPEITESTGITSTVTYLPAEYVFTETPRESPTVQQGEARQETAQPASKSIQPMSIASGIWLAGIAVMVLYSIVMYLHLYRNLVGAMLWRGNVYLADYIGSPFILGVVFPKIYLPSNTPIQERRYIVAHERHHIRRGDHIVKLLAYLALCIHWFNPLVWAAFILAGKDMEMSCDEAVIKKLGEHIRADYSASLLRLATGRKIISGTPLAFGEGDTKGRVMNMAAWKRPKRWVSILCAASCILLLPVCALNPKGEGQSPTEAEAEGKPVEIVMVNGATTAGFGELFFILPAGYSMEATEADVGDDAYMMQISDGSSIIGGVVYYDAPDFDLISIEDTKDMKQWNQDEWIAALGLSDALDETLGYMGGNSMYADYEIEYFTDLPEPVEHPVLRQHYLLIWEDGVYDLWFDKTVAKQHVIESIMKTAAVGRDGPLLVETTNGEIAAPIAAEVTLQSSQIQYGALTMTIPEGYEAEEDDGSVSLLKDSQKVGGITLWRAPDVALTTGRTTENNSEEWVKALGLPEAQFDRESQEFKDEPIAYMIETSVHDYLSAEYTNELYPEKLNVDHHFFIAGDVVYDVWYDQNIITDGEAMKFLETIYIAGEPTVITKTEQVLAVEQTDLEKCRAVLEAVQSRDAYKIITERENGEYALNATSTFTEWGYGENRLSINRIPESDGYESMFGGLLWDGVPYECDSARSWTESDRFEFPDPWLASYQWNEKSVTYIDTLTDTEGTTVMLRIDEPYADWEDYDPHYFVNFHFAPDGAFLNAQIQVNLFKSNEMIDTESIITLEPETVAAEIYKEYQHATAS